MKILKAIYEILSDTNPILWIILTNILIIVMLVSIWYELYLANCIYFD